MHSSAWQCRAAAAYAVHLSLSCILPVLTRCCLLLLFFFFFAYLLSLSLSLFLLFFLCVCSNVLWNTALQKAVIIDFDVSSYFDPVKLHRSMVGTDGLMAPEMLRIKYAKRRQLPLPYKGYDQAVDTYAAGMCLGQLLFAVSENDVADLENDEAKGEAFIQRVQELASRGQATLAHHLLVQMLHPEPSKRITVDAALAHPWLAMA